MTGAPHVWIRERTAKGLVPGQLAFASRWQTCVGDVRYVRGDIADDLREALKAALAHVNKISPSQRECEDLALGRAAIAKAEHRES